MLSKKRRKIILYSIINEYKAERGCKDCGNKFPEYPQVLDFDHLDSNNKKAAISSMLQFGNSLQLIIDEIAKCELVCANCHRIRTFKRRHKISI